MLGLGHKPAACGGAWLSGGLGPGLSGPSPSQPLASFGDSASISSSAWVACGAPGLPGSVCSQLLLWCLGPGHYRPQQRPVALRGCVSMQRRSRHPLRSSSPAAVARPGPRLRCLCSACARAGAVGSSGLEDECAAGILGRSQEYLGLAGVAGGKEGRPASKQRAQGQSGGGTLEGGR